MLTPVTILAQQIDILPTPHYVERLEGSVHFAPGVPIRVRIAQPHLKTAEETLASGFPEGRFQLEAADADVVLWDYSTSSEVPANLNFLDRSLLGQSSLRAQSYILRMQGRTIWVVGGGSAGVLYGAATLSQLLRQTSEGIDAPAVYIRDFPNFEFRAASDWLLNAEVNRWALDRGQGLAEYGRLVKKRIDRAVQYKINVALIDGFGWSLEKRPAGYAPLMRNLNRYARERGMLLQFGGYGAAYDIAQREGEYEGKVFLNRESYPNGRVFQCLAFPERKGGIDPRTMGSCRSNDRLNQLKAEDLAHFVDAVEPGVLYIHHEDCCVFEDFQKAWLGRCERCRRRWPNNSLLAADGGAGALAHGYSTLIHAVNAIRHPDTQYDAARDTQIVLVSPVYMPATDRSEDWGQVLELWRTIARLLPKTANVQICFREVLPQSGGGQRFITIFNSLMRAEKLPFGAYAFVVGGADNFMSDYATTGIPAMNAYFEGARTIYNATGDFYREPLEILAAEYSWNTRSRGFFRSPANASEMSGIEQWIYTPATPAEIYGPGRLFDRICTHLYGSKAGAAMSRYYRRAEWLPDVDTVNPSKDRPYYRYRKSRYLPQVWNYVTAIPAYWNYLMIDSHTWGSDLDEKYQQWLSGFALSAQEVHRRLSRRWSLAAELNASGAKEVQAAQRSQPRQDTVEDLQFLEKLFTTNQPLLEALRDYHAARARPHAPETPGLVRSALQNARRAGDLAEKNFRDPVDPLMGEIRSLRVYPAQLADAITSWEKSK